MSLSLVYRGPLATCGYRCRYCSVRAGAPGRRGAGGRAADRADAVALKRFVRWVAARPPAEALSVLFAPRGEVLGHSRYREALVRLAALPQVRIVAAQTNLSLDPAHLAACDRNKTLLWASFHPTETEVEPFAARVRIVVALGLRCSVGSVAIPAHLPAIEALRRLLPAEVPTWLNRRHGARPLAPPDLARARALDPLYLDVPPRSRGRPCAAGSSMVVVEGQGEARRCLALPGRLGNLYDDGPEAILSPAPRPCPAPVCRCHLGQVHLEPALAARYGDALLGRVPLPGVAAGREAR